MIERQFRETIARYDMLRPGDRVLVAVSGGPDSTALLLLLLAIAREMRLELHVAHLNHGWRGRSAAADAEFVRRLAIRHRLPVTVGQIAPSTWTGHRGRQTSKEARAREMRMTFLIDTARQIGARRIALGHTREDQAESFLMRLMRGSGARGLAGIYPVVDNLFIRPLIASRRRDIIAYLKTRRVRYRVDPTNRDTRLARNRIRRRLIPLLERDYNPAIIETLSDTSDILRDEDRFMDEAARSVYVSLIERDHRGILLGARPLRKLHPALRRRVLRMALGEVRGDLRRLTRAHVEKPLRLLEESRGRRVVTLPDGLIVRLEGNQVLVTRKDDGGSREDGGDETVRSGALCREALCPVPGRVALHGFDLMLSAQVVERAGTPERWSAAGSNQAYLDADLLPGPLLIRPRRAGDRFVPLGAPGSRKVKSFLIDRKVPVDERGRIPLVLSGDRIAWVVGHQIDDRFKVTANTRRILVLEKESQ